MSIPLRPLILSLAAVLLTTPVRAQTGFVAEYPPVQGAAEARMREGLMEMRLMEEIAAGLNRWIRMPRRVALRTMECTASDIRWNAEDHAVELCYRMMTRIGGIAAGQDSLRPMLLGAHVFMTFHAVSHALVDELDLATGPDAEATIDEITALLVMASAREDSPVQILRGITALQRADPGWGEWAYATEHGLAPARFQNVACLVYGANPERFDGLRQAGLVPPGSRQRCRTAGGRLLEVWGRRLGRYLN